ncbi:hypothetical protein FEM48_Zijuj03G0171400 [Ziziphus jujuba var. spinosa]|uniref:Uncharacterized protein n=1 Tax=Ziziphus jujuba var. spinosa TaxID=714518 RepID=A0A978VRK3_ZIZJJ|nr:hypothetical protein FEM48_Zijuj03G0171400 [Ziziphus jujuba var. spinosa]
MVSDMAIEDLELEKEDPFLRLTEYARSIIYPEEEEEQDQDMDSKIRNGPDPAGIGLLLGSSRLVLLIPVYICFCVLDDISYPLGTDIYLLTLGDIWSSNTIDLYLHRKSANITCIGKTSLCHFSSSWSYQMLLILLLLLYEFIILHTLDLKFHLQPKIRCFVFSRYCDLADPTNVILKKGREILLTRCYLCTAAEGSCYPRLLPTEYLVILLDEDEDDDAMLLAAQFCSDSFSSISLNKVNRGVPYSLYARIESIGPLEFHGKIGSLQKKQITLVDNDRIKLKFLLWGEQVLLANLFSIGSMLALNRPYIATSLDDAVEASAEICLKYVHAPKFLKCLCPVISKGSIDFSNYPFQNNFSYSCKVLQPFVTDLQDKMIGISLYAVVTNIMKERRTIQAVFILRIQDATGEILAKLHFAKSWY